MHGKKKERKREREREKKAQTIITVCYYMYLAGVTVTFPCCIAIV
jgi:uncharacterized membrane protein